MPAAPRPRAVVFDLDGLMFNTEDFFQEVGDRMLRRWNKRYDDALRREMMGRPARQSLQRMIDYHGLTDVTLDELQAESERLFDEVLDHRLAPMPGLVALLEELERRGVPKGVATSSRPAHVRSLLNRFAWEARFAFLLTSDDVTHGKPDPEIYLRAAARHGVAPAEMVVLEDSGVGCRAAHAAGAIVVAVPTEHSRDHEFPPVALRAETLADPRLRALLFGDG